MDLVDYQKKIDGSILVLTLESSTRKEEYEHGRFNIVTTHTPLVHLFNSVSEANKKLQEISLNVLGVWELRRDLSGCLVREKIAVDQERTVVDVSKIEQEQKGQSRKSGESEGGA